MKSPWVYMCSPSWTHLPPPSPYHPSYTEWSKPERKTPIQYTNALYGIYKDGNNNPVCETPKRHRCIDWSFGLCGKGRGWDDLGGWHWNMYNIICETNHQSRFDAGYRMLGAGALGWRFFLKWPRVSVILVSQASFIFHSCFLNSKPFFTSGYWLFQTLAVISLSTWWDKGH